VKKVTVGIAGAGLLGRLTAWQLLRQGVDVSLFEAGTLAHCAGAARTAAAMISPLSELVDSERLIYDMGLHSLSLWPQWNQQLSKPVHYRNTGSLVVAHRQDHSQLTQFAAKLAHHLETEESTSSPWQWLDQNGITEYEPELNHFQRALLLNNEAYLDNHALLDQLLMEIQRLGGHLVEHTPIVSVVANQLQTADTKHDFDWVIDCRGVGAKDDIDDLRGVRGEVLWVQTNEVKLTRPVRFMHPKYKLYVVPKPNNQYIIGATEIESEDLSPVSLRSNLELSSALYALHPAFGEARITATDVNLRPSLQDNLPRLEIDDGLIRANGLYRHGYLLAPAVVESIVAKILEKSSKLFDEKIVKPSCNTAVSKSSLPSNA